jgi:hypothetical protein
MFVACSTLSLLAFGCHHSLERPGNVDVIIEDGGSLPTEIAGRWKSDEQGWEFEFAPDGRILSAVISLGRVEVIPGRTTTVPTRSGNQAVFTPGRWTVGYAPATRQLTVRIVMDHVRVEMAGNIVEGASTDVFASPVDPATGVWQTQWTTFTKYTAHTPENTSFDLSTDPIYGETQPLTFRKTTAP